jgi:hypothetical protein
MRMLYTKDIDYENLESLKDNMFNKKIDVPL